MHLKLKKVVDIDKNEFTKNNGLKIDLKINLDLKEFFKKSLVAVKKKKNYDKWISNFSNGKTNTP